MFLYCIIGGKNSWENLFYKRVKQLVIVSWSLIINYVYLFQNIDDKII